MGSANQLLSYRPPEYDNPAVLPTMSPLQTYSLYPFLSPRAPPWQVNTSGTFRWRRVGDWLGIDQVENVKETGGLAGERGAFRDLKEQVLLYSTKTRLADDISFSGHVQLRQVLKQGLPEVHDASVGYKRIITAQ